MGWNPNGFFPDGHFPDGHFPGEESAPGSDDVPDAFAFADKFNVALSTQITSDPIVVAGIDTAAAIEVTGGEYSINGGAFTSDPGTVANGDSVRARHTSSASNNTATDTVITIGGVSDTFSSTTVPAANPAENGVIASVLRRRILLFGAS